LIHINLDKEVITSYKEGIKVFKGTYYHQVKPVQATKLEFAVAQEHMKTLENKIELLKLKLEVPVDNSQRWKSKKHNGMLDCRYGTMDSSRNDSRKSFKIATTRTKQSSTTQSTPPKQDSGKWLLPLR
jgi:hypothetical protein